jgi:hypothetical protein
MSMNDQEIVTLWLGTLKGGGLVLWDPEQSS